MSTENLISITVFVYNPVPGVGLPAIYVHHIKIHVTKEEWSSFSLLQGVHIYQRQNRNHDYRAKTYWLIRTQKFALMHVSPVDDCNVLFSGFPFCGTDRLLREPKIRAAAICCWLPTEIIRIFSFYWWQSIFLSTAVEYFADQRVKHRWYFQIEPENLLIFPLLPLNSPTTLPPMNAYYLVLVFVPHLQP